MSFKRFFVPAVDNEYIGGRQRLAHSRSESKMTAVIRLKATGMKQADIARKLGVSPQFVHQTIKRQQKP